MKTLLLTIFISLLALSSFGQSIRFRARPILESEAVTNFCEIYSREINGRTLLFYRDNFDFEIGPIIAGLYAELSLADTTNTIDMAAGTYTNIVSGGAYTYSATNSFAASKTDGEVTITIPGDYYVSYHIIILAGPSVINKVIEARAFIDGVANPHTTSIVQIGSVSGYYSLKIPGHILSLTNGQVVDLRMRNRSNPTTDVEIILATLLVGTP